MPRHAKSDELKKREASRVKTALQAEAVSLYKQELEKKARGEEWKGARKICDEVVAKCKRETGKNISLNHSTIIRHAAGLTTRAESNAKRSLLSLEQQTAVIDYIIELANRGFGLSHRRLKEHVDEILQVRLFQQRELVSDGHIDLYSEIRSRSRLHGLLR